MPNPILKQAAVIGAGMGGLAAAKAIAPHFEKVIVFDRDALPDAPAPRPGTPQARHTHVLLPGGCRALDRLFPGIELDLVEAGAVRMRMRRDMRFEVPGFDPLPQRDLGFNQFLLSPLRPGMEQGARERDGERLCAAVVCAGRGLPVRLEPRDRRDGRGDDDREGRARSPLP
jgi:hypothetical protein